MSLKYIETIPMCGGSDKAFHVIAEFLKNSPHRFYFCTDEGISVHPSKEDMLDCLNNKGFVECLKVKTDAIHIAALLKGMNHIPVEDHTYLINKINLWNKG